MRSLDKETTTEAHYADDAKKLEIKADKILCYWTKTSFLIPNVFRLTQLIEDDPYFTLEYQDLSNKELLVQSNGQKPNSLFSNNNSQEEFESELVKKPRKTKGCVADVTSPEKRVKGSRLDFARALLNI